MAVTTARIASLLNHMEEKQLICRYPDPDDSRQIVVVLTQEGKEAIQQDRARGITCVADMVEGLGPEDAEAYIRIKKKKWSHYQKSQSIS